jgi:hypothetical protein
LSAPHASFLVVDYFRGDAAFANHTFVRSLEGFIEKISTNAKVSSPLSHQEEQIVKQHVPVLGCV